MKQKFLLKTMLLLSALVVGLGNVWATVKVGDTMWAETWTGATTATAGNDEATPSANCGKGTTVYNSGSVTYTQSANTVYVRNENTGGGTKPELLLSSGKTWTISNIPTGGASELTLTYVSNNTKSSVTCSTSGASISGSSKSYTITTGGAETITLVFGCSGNTRIDNVSLTVKSLPAVAITSIAFSEPKTASVVATETVTLTPTVLPANYTETIDWESDDTDVATVSSTGVVTGVAAGTAHITAKSHGNPSTIYDVCTVTVTAPVAVTGVSLKSSTTLLLGGTETLVPTISPADATNKNVIWVSNDDSKVSVDDDGVITALALTNGTPVVITVVTEDGDFEAECAVTVNPIAVTGISLKPYTTIEKEKTETLTPTFYPSNATNKTVTWDSDDTSVATVSAAGVVTGVAAGTANITVTTDDGDYTATCVVTVVNKKGSIDAPYSVADVIAMAPTNTSTPADGQGDVYVIGYIVGGFNTSSTFTTDPTYFQNSNLALADNYDESTAANVIPVQLTKDTDPRTYFNVIDHSQFVNVVKVVVKADVLKYFSVPGLKNVDEMSAIAEAVKVTDAGYATWASDSPLDFTGKAIKAYIAEGQDGSKGVTFAQVNKIPANTGVLLYKDGGATEEIPVTTASTDYVASNVFVPGTGAAVASVSGSVHNYILNNIGGNIGFYRANGQTVAKNRAYIQIDESIWGSSSIKEFIALPGFEDDADGISLAPALSEGEGAIYNVAGQRLSKMQKGINIVNGKKVLK